MKYTTLGTTDIEVSKICLGTMNFGQQNSEDEAHAQLDYARDKGINFIDTAEVYAIPPTKDTQGLTEKYIGTWMTAQGNRQEIVLATKITGPQPALTWFPRELIFSPEQLRLALEGSLRRLNTDYIDLYQLHWPERKTNFFGTLNYQHDSEDPWVDNFAEILETMQTFQQEGKVRYVGISNETPWGMMHYLEMSAARGLPRIQSIQNPYNLLNRSFEIGLAEMAIREKVGLLAYSPMAFGLLSGKYHRGEDTPRDRINLYSHRMTRYSGEQSQLATQKYLEIAEKHGLSLAQMSLAFVNQQPFVTTNIIGATTMDQLRENIASIDVVLSEELVREIELVSAVHSNPAP